MTIARALVRLALVVDTSAADDTEPATTVNADKLINLEWAQIAIVTVAAFRPLRCGHCRNCRPCCR
eukprot:2831849-Lingulodinium_polyedra.AAC.1